MQNQKLLKRFDQWYFNSPNYTSWRAHICTSSIVQLDAWTWEDAIMKENDGMHLNFPSSYKSGSWFEPGTIEENKEYKSQVDEIITFFGKCKSGR
jgi:hypothetical protein